MAAQERIFFAGVGTTFAILAIGFGGGLLMANSAVHDSPIQKKLVAGPPAARVVLPTSAEPALQVTATAPRAAPSAVPAPAVAHQGFPAIRPDPVLQAAAEKQIERDQAEKEKEQGAKRRKAEAEKRKRYAETRARRARQEQERQQRQQQEARQQEPRILAFDDQSKSSFGFFGN